MKKLVYIIGGLLFGFLQTNAQTKTTIDVSKMPTPGPTPTITIPTPVAFTMPNGLKVYIVENHKIPKISLLCQLKYDQPLEKEMTGMNQILGGLIASGTKTKTKDQINTIVDGLGADLNFTTSSFYISSLTRHFNSLIDLASDIVLNNNMDEKEMQFLIEQSIDGLQESKDDPDAQLGNASAVKNYGTNHPYGEIPTEESLKKVSLLGCKTFFNTYYKPNIAYMAIVGDISVEEAKKMVTKYFSAWARGVVPQPTYSNKGNLPKGREVVFVSKKSAVQSNFAVTFPTQFKPNSPDKHSVSIANYILGGGSSSKLFMNLREKHGWTYGAYSSLSSNDLIANFNAGAKCRNAVTDSAVQEVLNEMINLKTKPVIEKELKAAKSYLAGSFSRSLESPQTIASMAINQEIYKLPADYYKNYLKNLNAVSAEQVKAAATKYFNTDNVFIIVSGNEDETKESLLKFDSDKKIEVLDYLGRVPEKPKQVTGNLTAQNIVDEYISATGGIEIWNKVKDMSSTSKATVQGMDLTITMKRKEGNKMLVVISAGSMVFNKQVCNGKKAYIEAQGQTQDLEKEELNSMIESGNIHLDLQYAQLGYKLNLEGTENVEGEEAYKVKITNPSGATSYDYYSVKTKYKIKSENDQGTQFFSDYKDAWNGFKIPYTITVIQGPQKIKSTIDSVKFNTGIDDAEFE